MKRITNKKRKDKKESKSRRIRRYTPITLILGIIIRLRLKSWKMYIMRRQLEIVVARLEGGVSNHANLEFTWTVLPMIILVTLSVPSLRLIYFAEAPTYEEVLLTNEYKTRVTGHQWFWNYICDKIEVGLYLAGYSTLTFKIFKQNSFDSYLLALEDILEIGGARLLEVDNCIMSPLSEKLSFLITSSDVLHAWTIPSLGIKLDAIPGRLSSLSVYPTMSGTYYGQCSEICGIGHGFMPIKLYII